MRRSSYLSRIARVEAKSRLSLTPARVLFRPPPLPIPDGPRAERPAIFPAEVTPVEPRWGGEPLEPTRNFTLPSKQLNRSRDTRTPVAPKLPLAPLGRSLGTESSSAVTPGGEMRPLQQVCGPVLAPSLAPLSSAKTGPGVSANVEPRVVSAKPTSGGPASVEPQFGVARDQAARARPGRHPKARSRSSNEAVATFDSSSLDMMGPRQASQHRSANVTDSATGQSTFPAAPVSKRASETSPTLLIPPPPAGAEKRATVNTETGPGLRIGSLEVRIMPPPPVTPPAPAAFLRQPGPSRPHIALSRGFRSFGLTQA